MRALIRIVRPGPALPLALLSALLSAGCGAAGLDDECLEVAIYSAPAPTVAVGDSVALDAGTARRPGHVDANGASACVAPGGNAGVTWLSRDATIARVTATSHAVGLRPGVVTLSARNDASGREASVELTVTP